MARKSKTRAVIALWTLLAFVLLLPSEALADTYINGYLRYTVDNESITIVRYVGKEEEVYVPAMIAGDPVNTIASGAFTDCEMVRMVYLPDCITSVEEGAFDVGQAVVYNYNLQGSTEGDDTSVEGASAPSTVPVGITLANGTLLSVDDEGNLVWVDGDTVEHVVDDTKTYAKSVREDGTLSIRDAEGNEVQVDDQGVVTFAQQDGTQVALDAAAGSITYTNEDGSSSHEDLTDPFDEAAKDAENKEGKSDADAGESASKHASNVIVPALVVIALAGAAYIAMRAFKK